MFTLKTYDKNVIDLTDTEANGILEAMAQNKEMVIVRGSMIKTANISGIYNNASESRGDQNVGYLHDGTRVIKQFGRWVCDDGHMDEKGFLLTYPSREYYSEVSADLVATIDEWHLLGTGFYEANKERIQRVKLGSQQLTPISSLLSGYKPQQAKLIQQGYDAEKKKQSEEPSSLGKIASNMFSG